MLVLNMDGSSMENPCPAGFGGLLRTGQGDWRLGFYGSIGISENLQAKLAAVRFGLSTAWESRVRRLVCYSDSKMAIELN